MSQLQRQSEIFLNYWITILQFFLLFKPLLKPFCPSIKHHTIILTVCTFFFNKSNIS